MNALVIFAKFPEAGKVKKKIGQVIGMDTSAKLCECFINDLISAHNVQDYDLYLSFIGHEYKEKYRTMFSNVILYVQRGSNLGENLFFSFEDLLDDYDKVVIIGCDAPTVGPDLATKAFNALDSYDVVLGPVSDGGYYLIGMKQPRNIFEGLPFGTDKLIQRQVELLKTKGLTFVMLEELDDIDTIDELKKVKSCLKRERAPKTYDFMQKIDV